ncbi:hypothetical protein AVEN_55791-1 [Araneus ventricosus]|uniref:Uncharacterized protein n=1 Tax=Araneus ventricosus TaxID=182803 RepID=A0A4Y2EX91_ARAVE|nr:hypothetical protein AVEN_55791-1 [Araneus ventricosus]
MNVAEQIRMNITEESLSPKFENEIVENGDKVIIRSNLETMVDINEWVKELGIRTNTKWNCRKSCPAGEKFVCWKKFECHHSSFNKVPVTKNTKAISKNAACQASVTVKIKLNTMRTRMTDVFIRRGLVGVITVAPFHTHSLMTAETLRFLPAENCREEFETYFNAGMGPAESSKYHTQILERNPALQPSDLANSRINPSKRTVAYWHEQWRLRHLGPRNEHDVIEISTPIASRPIFRIHLISEHGIKLLSVDALGSSSDVEGDSELVSGIKLPDKTLSTVSKSSSSSE